MEAILEDEVNVYIRHELGEVYENLFPVDTWRELIAAFPQSPIELLVRALRDLLADTNDHGTLNFIIREKKAASLGFFTAFLDGLRRELFPEMRRVFGDFVETGDWGPVEAARRGAHEKASRHVNRILSAFEDAKEKGRPDLAAGEIERTILAPMGIIREEV
jgi:hypothetical protein